MKAGMAQHAPTIWLPKALPHQVPVLLSPARFKVLACGRRWGKTALGLMATTRGHGPHRRALLGAMDGGTIWWVAPTFTIASLIWRNLKKATREAWVDKSELEHRIELPGGGSVSVRSADNPDALRGEGLDGVVVDEAAFLNERAWKESLRPALSDKQGWAIFISTPNGQNWFYDLFHRAGSDDGIRQRWQQPSSDNPLMTAAELEEAKLDIGLRAFAQEYLAQFTDQEGAEFPGDYFRDSVWFDHWPDEGQIRCRVMALDPSKGKSERSDYSAFAMIALAWDGTMYVDADLERRSTRQIVDDGLVLARDFRCDAFGCEINQFQEVLADQMAERSRACGMMLPFLKNTSVYSSWVFDWSRVK